MKHPQLWKGLALTALIVTACVLAITLLYFTGMDFR